MRDGRRAVLVYQGTADKAVQRKRRIEFVRAILRNRVCKDPAGPWSGLESPRAPAAVEIEPANRRLADDRTGIRADVDNSAPHSQHSYPAEDREQFDDGLHRVLDRLKAAALAVTRIGVDTGADDEFALVRLADVTVHGARHDNRVEHGLQRLGNECLQRVTLDRQTQASHCGQYAGVAGNDDADLARPYLATGRFDAGDFAAVTTDTGDLALLDDVDTQSVRGSRKSPGVYLRLYLELINNQKVYFFQQLGYP